VAYTNKKQMNIGHKYNPTYSCWLLHWLRDKQERLRMQHTFWIFIQEKNSWTFKMVPIFAESSL